MHFSFRVQLINIDCNDALYMLIFVLLRFSASAHTQGCDVDSGERPTGRTAERTGAAGGAGKTLPGQVQPHVLAYVCY